MELKMMRIGRVKTMRLLVIAMMLVAALVGYSRPRGWEQSPSPGRIPLPELGADDGFAFVVFYGSDIDGNLETCG
jgi:hypothetical protein